MAKGYLVIKVDESDAENFAKEVDKHLPSSWKRATDWEHRLKEQSIDKEAEWYIYQNDTAGVCISRDNSETLKVTNIVPIVAGHLSDNEYNAIQQEFQRIVQKTAFPSYISGEQAKLVITPRAQKALEAFSDLANKSTGSAHPSDLQRWIEFLVIAHEDRCYPDSGSLAQYLEEALSWPANKAHDLAGESEFANVLLDRVRRS